MGFYFPCRKLACSMRLTFSSILHLCRTQVVTATHPTPVPLLRPRWHTLNFCLSHELSACPARLEASTPLWLGSSFTLCDSRGRRLHFGRLVGWGGFLGFWVSGFLGFWVSGFLGFWVSGFLGFWVSGFLGWERPSSFTEALNILYLFHSPKGSFPRLSLRVGTGETACAF